MKRFFPSSAQNIISVSGAAIAAVSFATILFFSLVEAIQDDAPAYIGIVSYIILPVPLVIGLLLIPIGMIRERRRILKGLPQSRLSFTINLNIPRQQALLTFFLGTTFILLLFTAYGSYRAFEWTESVEFCGETCHSVMEPEFTAYQNSPHARVKCVECHVGSGAGWYVRSKLSGAYQVYATAMNSYPRPIPTPIRNLRPAQETCEQCHWPSHFAGDKKDINTYFRSNEQNSRWTVALLMKTGGGNPDAGPAAGIHWHMNIANEIVYQATDSLRQVIPLVTMRNKHTGDVTEFVSTEFSGSLDELRKVPGNRMDCIDCHNRPSHIYRPPVRIVDQSLNSGSISTGLPNVRAASIQVLVQPYSTREAAMDSIPRLLQEFYEDQYPEVAGEKKHLIEQASNELKNQYSKNFFPGMKVDWRAYPDNIGHMTNLGCFRCHDGKHVSSTGRVISKDCNSCHTILYQGEDPKPTTLAIEGLEFRHPEDIGDLWKEVNCNECHTGQ